MGQPSVHAYRLEDVFCCVAALVGGCHGVLLCSTELRLKVFRRRGPRELEMLSLFVASCRGLT